MRHTMRLAILSSALVTLSLIGSAVSGFLPLEVLIDEILPLEDDGASDGPSPGRVASTETGRQEAEPLKPSAPSQIHDATKLLVSLNDLVGSDKYEDSYRLTQTINSLIDSILTIGLANVDPKMPIPDIHKKQSRKIGFVRVHISFDAEEGSMENIQTLKRVGDSTIDKNGDSCMIATTLGFQKLAVHFQKYHLKALGISARGKVTGEVRTNAFLFKVGLRKTSTECHLFLSSFKLTQFDHIKVTLSGGNHLVSKLESMVATWLGNHFRNKIRDLLEAKVRDKLTEVIQKHEKDICKLFKKKGGSRGRK